MANERRYIPALRFRWLTGLYDPVLRITTREATFKKLLVEQAAVETGRILDLGCGTATLTVMLKRRCPSAEVAGLDGDPQILEIAGRKVASAGVDIELIEGLAYDPPMDPGSFDRVVSSLVFHHLRDDDKRTTFSRVRDLLKPGGELHIADWGQAANPLMRFAFLGVQLLDGFETTSANVRGELPSMMSAAGFSEVSETRRLSTMFGTISLYRAVVPTPEAP